MGSLPKRDEIDKSINGILKIYMKMLMFGKRILKK